MPDQPANVSVAERLAQWLESFKSLHPEDRQAAAELRRLATVEAGVLERAARRAARYTVVPIVDRSSDFNEHLGEVCVLTSALPPTPEFVFTLRYLAEQPTGCKVGEMPSRSYAGPYKLVDVAIQTDEHYARYLRQVGLVGAPPSTGCTGDCDQGRRCTCGPTGDQL